MGISSTGQAAEYMTRDALRDSLSDVLPHVDDWVIHGFLEDPRSLDITIDDESFGHIFGDVHRLAVEHGLSGYDAACLELGIRKGLPLATLDEDLQKAAQTAVANYSSQPVPLM
jgi:predicted nucleic acid-binding protein